MFSPDFFSLPIMSELLVTCATTWFSLFLRGLQFKNVQHERLWMSTFISSVIKMFDLIAIGFAVNSFNIFIIILAGFSAGFGTLCSLWVEQYKR